MSNNDSQKNDTPKVLVYIGWDDPTRGDSHGFTGIGKMLAEKIHGEFHYLEEKHLKQLYPNIESSNDALRAYFQDHGQPDVVFSTNYFWLRDAMSRDPVMSWGNLNETLAESYMNEHELVCHHLTPDILAKAGKKFRAEYPQITAPLIAVLVASDMEEFDAFADKLISKCETYPETTIFLCSSRRTSSRGYTDAMHALEDKLKEKGLTQRVKLMGYDFKAHEQDPQHGNPYTGLLNEASHLIVYGVSRSLVAEALVTGKTPLLYKSSNIYKQLTEKGLVRPFNDCADKAPFETAKIKPVNLTEDVTDKMAREFAEKIKPRGIHLP